MTYVVYTQARAQLGLSFRWQVGLSWQRRDVLLWGLWTSQLVLAWNKKQTVSQETFSLVTPTFALISNKSVTFQFLTISLQVSQTKWAVEFGKRAEARVDLRERSFGRFGIKPWLAKPQIWRRKVSVNFDRNSGRKFMKPGAWSSRGVSNQFWNCTVFHGKQTSNKAFHQDIKNSKSICSTFTSVISRLHFNWNAAANNSCSQICLLSPTSAWGIVWTRVKNDSISYSTCEDHKHKETPDCRIATTTMIKVPCWLWTFAAVFVVLI